MTAPPVLYSLLAGGLALLGPGLRLSRSSAPPVPRRSLPVIASMLLLSGLAYVLYYQVTGSITFQYFTREYYPEAVHQVLELGVWFWVIQFGRGTAMALVVVPFIYTLRMSRRATALLTGLLLWVAGGLAPLLAPNDLMTPMQRFIHVVELLTQLAPLGITAALLLRPRSARAAPTAALLTSPQSNPRWGLAPDRPKQASYGDHVEAGADDQPLVEPAATAGENGRPPARIKESAASRASALPPADPRPG